jgi:citrate synthase
MLRITRATLYAYVSRGLIGTEPDPVDPRRRLYRTADIERLLAGKERSRKPKAIAAATLDWGTGALPTSITLIERGHLYYRGQDATGLAATATLEDVARLLWDCGPSDPFDHPPEAAMMPLGAFGGAAPLDRCRAMLALLGSGARPLWNRDRARLGADAAALLRALVAMALGTPPDTLPIHGQIAAAWRLDRAGADLVRAALVLLADHDLNPSTFATRVVAGTGASLSACLSAGLAALTGPLHGGATALAEALLASARQSGDTMAMIAARLGRGETIPAFGHPLYPDGDPRAAFLLARLPSDPARATLIDAVAEITGLAPNVDFALASLIATFNLPSDSGIALFAIARSVGWVAHALEQSATRRLIRPRADYVGIRPPAAERDRRA